jgi:hypothetical protein
MRRVLGLMVLTAITTMPALAGEVKKYGAGVTLNEGVSVAELLAAPEKFVGKKVRVDGVVTAVCAKRGCWMMITDPEREQGIRIKVEDGVIVFPMEAMGRKASAEGIFEVVNPAGEKHDQAQHATQAGGEHASGASCAEQEKAAKKASATYQIAGTGAIVY